MHPVMEQQGQLRAELHCSPVQVAFAEMLALGTMAFEARVAAELDANPALERLDPTCSVCGGVVGGPCCRRARPRQGDGADIDAVTNIPSSISMGDALLREIAPIVPAPDRWVLEHLVGSLDERGLLDAPPDDIAARLGVRRDRVDRILTALRSLTCPGAGASTLREHLVLELDALEPDPLVDLARTAVEHDFAALARGETVALARVLGTDPETVARVRELIRVRLHPYPLLGDAGAPSPGLRTVALPDVAILVAADGVSVTVRVLEADRVQLRLSAAMTQLTDVAWAARAVASARVFLDRVRRRWDTIQAVATVVAQRQREFVLDRAALLRPLTRAAVAAELGFHESTVGRAVNGRHVLVPSGSVLPFSSFFQVAPDVCEALRGIVASEERPLTDAELSTELARHGHHIARRTVVKYRHRLGIATALQRG